MSGTLQASVVKDSASATNNLALDSSGNVGVGVTPNAWSGFAALQMSGPAMWGSSGLGHWSVNTYYDGTNYKYITTNYATDYYQLNGTHVWRYAPSGSAGTNVSSFTEAMRIDASGNLGIGTSSPNTKVQVYKASNSAFTGSALGGFVITDSNATLNYYSSLDFNTMSQPTVPVARIGMQYTGGGTYLNFGTSNNYVTGITNTAMSIDPTGNVGIGTTSPGSYGKLAVNGNANFFQQVDVTTNTGAAYGLRILADSANTYSGIQFTNNPVTAAWGYYRMPSSSVHQWLNSNAIEQMRIDASGNLLVGTNNASGTAGEGLKILDTGRAATTVASYTTSANSNWIMYSTGAGAYRFFVGWGGSINATSTSITAISDQSLKTNIRPLETGISEIMRLKPRRFDWKEETQIGETNVAGFIAQEVQEVLPELVYDYKYTDTETKLGLKMGDMLPTVVKALQEAVDKITALEDRIAKLESGI